MIDLFGYSITNKIQSRPRTSVYRGLRDSDRQPVLVKVHRGEYPDPADIAHFRHEFQITHELDLPGVVRSYGLESYRNGLALIQEDIGGAPLDEAFARGPLELERFLNLAARLADILGEVHRRDIVHRDVKPQNIFYNAEANELKLTDFGIASRLSRETQNSVAPEMLEGTLAYISPEQTGRMNRSIDYRTDFYSLGATLFEMLTGRPPFDADDPVELVYCHIARRPPAPGELRPDLPDQINRIIARLLEKNAEDRYQSAAGLGADLRECARRLADTGRIESFVPGRQDLNVSPRIPQKLYGREKQIAELLENFQRVSSESRPELMIIAGVSGTGKSALVREVQRPIVERRGYFAAGKFDELNRNTPYSALIQAVQELIREALTEGPEKINGWKSDLQAALGGNARVLVDVIPQLELIVGETAPVPELPPNESRNRFQSAFVHLIRVFAGAEHPLVLFLDDLQWADAATLRLVEQLALDPDLGYFFLVGALRDNEVSAAHPLARSLDLIRREGVAVGRIHLGPLQAQDLNRLVAETLHLAPEQSAPLADLVFQKTGGNPFFAGKFLLNLFREELLRYDPAQARWHWDAEGIARREFSENVVEFMTGQIDLLPAPTRKLMRLAAGIGDSFDLNTLALAGGIDRGQALKDLWKALEDEYVVPLDDSYKRFMDSENTEHGVPHFRFLHDRIRQAAYTMIADHERPQVHLKIGRSLFKSIDESEREIIFDITNHFNQGEGLIESENERVGAALLNFQAARRARASGAFETALKYLESGRELLPANAWSECYALALDINILMAECRYLVGHFEASEKLFRQILERARNPIDRSRVYIIQVTQCTNQGLLQEAILAGNRCLAMFGSPLPPRPGFLRLLLTGILPARLARGLRKVESLSESLSHSPGSERIETIVMMNTFSIMTSPAYGLGPNSFAMVVCRAVSYTLRHGFTRHSAYPLMLYATVLGSGLGRYEESMKFSRLAMQLRDRIPDPGYFPMVSFAAGTFVNHWTRPLRETIPLLQESYTISAENGNLIYACYARVAHSTQSFFLGVNLADLGETLDHHSAYVYKVRDPWMLSLVLSFRQLVRNLRGLTRDRLSFSDEDLNEEEFRSRTQTGIMMEWWPYCHACVLYLYEEYELALEQIEISESAIHYSFAQVITREHSFLYSLILTALWPAADRSRRRRFRQILKRNQKQLKVWARTGPENCMHQYLLVRAEIARVEGRTRAAMDLYDQAIQSARANGYVQMEALAGELAGKFYLSLGKEKIARSYLADARHGYLRWGADAKVAHIDEHPVYSRLNLERELQESSGTETSTLSGGLDLDLQSLLKASRAISGELHLDRLLLTVMRIAMENAGAARGCLLLERNGEFRVEVEAGQDGSEIRSRRGTVAGEALAASVIHYAARTGETVLLDDAFQEPRFKNDAYIRHTRLASLLCLPIKLQNKVGAVLYLENKEARGVFTPARLRVLNLLSGQAAVSIENARLYEMATTDMMTRLKLRHVFQTELEQARRHSAKSGEPLALVVTDIDHFKSFNDTYGHQTGDAVLIEVARVLIDHARPGEVAARYGGEEFCLVLPGSSAEEALRRAEEIRAKVADLRVDYEGRSLEVTLSAGVSRFDPRLDPDNKALIEKADQALYRAKEMGRNRCVVYE